MDVGEIRKLIRLMEEAGLTELEIEDRSGKVRLVRGSRSRAPGLGSDPVVLEAVEEDASDEVSYPAMPTGSHEPSSQIPPGMTEITSPMVGTFFRAPAPDAPPFVAPGDIVRPGQPVCIIEAMKMMNEVCAETTARIVSIQAENGAAVEYGSPLFLIELVE